jgi:drug/metabolite transporter (DMT)-like permease
VALVVIKKLAYTDSSTTTTLYAGLFLTPVTLVAALFVWSGPSAGTWLLLIAIGGLGCLTQWSVAQAFHEADTTVVLPFDFTKLIWASAIGYVFFDESPDPMTLIGGFVILASITYVAYREREVRST